MAVICLEAGAPTAIIFDEERKILPRVTSYNFQGRRDFHLGTLGGSAVFVALFMFFVHNLGVSGNIRYFVFSFSFFTATLFKTNS